MNNYTQSLLSHYDSETTYINISKDIIDGVVLLDLKYLQELNCSDNYITDIVILSQNLNILDCSNNIIESLDNLPTNLKKLDCSNNQITSLDNLPIKN